MNKGFTIRCDNCGNEVKFASDDSRINNVPDRSYDRNITQYECECGNEASDDEE